MSYTESKLNAENRKLAAELNKKVWSFCHTHALFYPSEVAKSIQKKFTGTTT